MDGFCVQRSGVFVKSPVTQILQPMHSRMSSRRPSSIFFGRYGSAIEGLAAPGSLHRIQEAFWNSHGLQCGFCTPGMVFAVHELLRQHPDPTVEQIRHGLEGNLCRCTGYQNIVKSVQAAAAAGGAR